MPESHFHLGLDWARYGFYGCEYGFDMAEYNSVGPQLGVAPATHFNMATGHLLVGFHIKLSIH